MRERIRTIVFISCAALVLGVVVFLFLPAKTFVDPDQLVRQQWKRSGPPSTERVILDAKWGDEPGQLTLVIPPNCQDCQVGGGFQRFLVRGKEIFILDEAKGRLVVFEDNRVKRAYETVAPDVFTVTDSDIYVLSGVGKLTRLDRKSGIEQITKEVVSTRETLGWVSLFELEDLLVVHHPDRGTKCFDKLDLSPRHCSGKLSQLARPHNTSAMEYVFTDGTYARTEWEEAWRYSSDGKIIAALPKVDVKIDFEFGYNLTVPLIYPSEEGVYYAQLSRDSAKIIFRPWER